MLPVWGQSEETVSDFPSAEAAATVYGFLFSESREKRDLSLKNSDEVNGA